MPLFGKKPTMKDQMRGTDRAIRQNQRTLERERNALDGNEKKLIAEIKMLAKKGDKQAIAVLAQQLVAVRKQRTKTYVVGSKLQSVGTQQKLMHSNVKIAETMATTSKTMAEMNKVMKPEAIAQTMRNFERENARTEMTEEMINDALDDIMNDSADEEEENNIVSQVLDEIGIEISGQVSKAPQARQSLKTGEKLTDEDLERQLAQLGC